MNKSLKILIADDNDLMRLIMKNFFLELSMAAKISETINLEQTYSTLKSEDFDLLILDINMPNGDATPAVVKDILLKYPQLKITMFSGNDRSSLETIYQQAGSIGFIQKDEDMKGSLHSLLNTIF